MVVVRHSPLGSVRASEALRMSVGLTLADNDITVLLLDSAAWLATPLSPARIRAGEIKKHIDTLGLLKMRVKVERESLEKCSIAVEEVTKGIEVVGADEIAREIAEAQATVVF